MCSPSGHWKPGPSRWWLEGFNFYTAHVLWILYMIFYINYISAAPNRTTPGEHPFYQKTNTWFRHPNTKCCRTAWYAMSRDRQGHLVIPLTLRLFFLKETNSCLEETTLAGRDKCLMSAQLCQPKSEGWSKTQMKKVRPWPMRWSWFWRSYLKASIPQMAIDQWVHEWYSCQNLADCTKLGVKSILNCCCFMPFAGWHVFQIRRNQNILKKHGQLPPFVYDHGVNKFGCLCPCI